MLITCLMLASNTFITNNFLTTNKLAIQQLLTSFYKYNIYIIVSRYALISLIFSCSLSLISNLSRSVCPFGFSSRLIREGACTVASLLFLTTINTALPPLLFPPYLASFSNFLSPVPGSRLV
jgi:hypothetical protein